MKNKIILGVILFLAFIFGQEAFAAGIVLRVNNTTLQNQSGGNITPTYTGPASAATANIEFFGGSVPVSPTFTSGRIDDFAYTLLSGSSTHQYENSGVDGGNVLLRTWDGTPRTRASHYGISRAYSAAGGAAPAEQYTIASFRTDYLADAPTNMPTITSVTESNQRIGATDNVRLNISINYSYSQGSSPNIVVETGYDVKYWFDPATEPLDTDTTRIVAVTGTSWSLPGTDPATGNPFGAGTYHFKVRATNEFGAGPWSATRDWLTLSAAAAGGRQSFNLILRSNVGATPAGPGINMFGLPFAPDTSGNWYIGATAIRTANDLVREINIAAGVNVVSSFGQWDKNDQLVQGIMIGYGEGLNNINSQTGVGGVANLAGITLSQGEGYQVYTNLSLMAVAGETLRLTISNRTP